MHEISDDYMQYADSLSLHQCAILKDLALFLWGVPIEAAWKNVQRFSLARGISPGAYLIQMRGTINKLALLDERN